MYPYSAVPLPDRARRRGCDDRAQGFQLPELLQEGGEAAGQNRAPHQLEQHDGH